MKILSERLADCQVKFSIEVEAQEMERAVNSAYLRLVKRVEIPGFRRGKAPKEIFERYIGRKKIVDEAIRILIPETYAQALKENNIEPFAPPFIEIKQEEPLSFTAIVPLKPTVELCDYYQIKLPLKPVSVSEEDIDKFIEGLCYEQAPWEPINREVRMGDMVTLEIEATVEGKPYLNRAIVQYIVGSSTFLPGFAENLLGMKEGEEKEFSLPFPSQHPNRGKECLFKVKIKGIKGKNPLSLEELVKSLNFSDFPSLRREVARQLKERREEEAKRELGERILEEIIANSRVEFPPILVERVLKQLPREGETEEELLLRAKKQITRSLILDKIAEKEGIKIEESEVEGEIERMAQGEKGEEVRRFFSSPQARNSLKERLLVTKTLSRLVEICGKEELDGS